MDELHTTMGQLVKLSEAILIGTVAKAEDKSAGDTWVECSVEDVILGSEMPEQVMLKMKGKPGPAIHEPQTALVFVPTALIHEDVMRTSSWDYRAEGLSDHTSNQVRLLFPSRTIILLTRENKDEYRSIITNYIHYLREPAVDTPASYFWFLHGLLETSDSRIQQDARADMIHLCRSLNADKLQEILDTDQPMDADIRDYADGIADWKRRGSPTKFRFPIPSDRQVQEWLLDLGSGDPSRANMALLELSETGEWLYRNVSVWRDAVADVLTDTNSARRLMAADLLINVRDLRAVPVLIEGLNSPEVGQRSACWDHLVKVLRPPVRYDPKAPEDTRKDMLNKFKSWHQQYHEALKNR
ncbi:MAG: hypothetical protein PHW82_15950 [Bacteroidales bacterium]|jgi:hypothetical protein|nr:hypothetical protein [Bacteroidales bacterium]MDY0126361.1 hypothetical protein [Anaerolineaceae bacterium]